MRSIRVMRERRSSVRWLTLIASASSALSLFGCDDALRAPIPAAHGDDVPRRGGTLRLASFADVRSIDPAATSDGLAPPIEELLFAGLVDYDDAGNAAPDLATHWDLSADGRTYKFYLRAGVRFHDGEELTADDVKRSIERALHPSTPNPAATLYQSIAGFDEYTQKKAEHLAGVVVEGRYVVSIRLNEPDATFLLVLALPTLRPVCKSGGERYADTWLPCGAGPFKLLPNGWDRGRSLTLVRNGAYYLPGKPYLDAVTWTWSMNIASERLKFEDGDLDSIREFNQPDEERFALDPRWAATRAFEPDRSIFGEAMNTEVPPFDNVEIRRAVAAAIDRDRLSKLRHTRMQPLTQVLPPTMSNARGNVVGQRYDYAAALEHMRKAGYPYDPTTKTGGYPNAVSYLAYKQSLPEYAGQLVQQDLEKIGIRLEIKIVSFPTYLAITHRRGKAAISSQGWTQDFPDPSDFFEPLFAGWQINDDDSDNAAFYRNERLDLLLKRAHRELDPRKRTEAYEEANRIVCDDAPWAFTYTNRWFDAWQPYVRNYKTHPVWTQPVKDVWLDRASDALARGNGLLSGGSIARALGFLDAPRSGARR